MSLLDALHACMRETLTCYERSWNDRLSDALVAYQHSHPDKSPKMLVVPMGDWARFSIRGTVPHGVYLTVKWQMEVLQMRVISWDEYARGRKALAFRIDPEQVVIVKLPS